MSSASIAPILAGSMGVAASPAALQPTAQQTARFEQLLQQGSPATEPMHYGAPLTGLGTDARAVVDYIGDASTHLKISLDPTATQVDLQDLPPELQQQLQLQRELTEEMRNMNNATLEFELIGKSVELAESTPRVLYQQG